MRKAVTVLSWIVLVAAAGTVQAHEGHQHKVMGTVVQVHADEVSHVEVKTVEGKTVILACDDKTRFVKGKAAAKLQDVVAGMRVVATTVEQGKSIRAVEVQLGEMDAAAKPKAAGHQH
ncbi:MAG: hypothetical protein KJ067_24615 [Vicinamibacteria bacterium]|jgi:hypothetical protein|nr:hypothetical protein [Vicinamibacteria bacterium]